MTQEQEKVVITKEIIGRYRRYKVMCIFRIIACIGMVSGTMIFCWKAMNSPSESHFAGGFFLHLAVTFCVGVLSCFLSWVLNSLVVPKCKDGFDILHRWEKISARCAEEFPLSELHLAAYEGWAIKSLRDRAYFANLAFKRQHAVRKASQEKQYWKMDPLEITELVKYYESAIAEADRKAQQSQRSFLDFWDLVTEKEGLKILKGYEWQDPERFRRGILGANECVDAIS